MNERIQKLIGQCTFIYDDMVYDGTDSYMKTTEYFDKEKFAELIVRECMYVGRLAQINNQLVDSEIKEHFGVEE